MGNLERTENYKIESKREINRVVIVKAANMVIKMLRKVIRIMEMYMVYMKCILMYIRQLKRSVFNSTFRF